MKPVNVQVTVNETPGKSKLVRFCEKKIDQWLESHADQAGAGPAEFKVKFTQETGHEAAKQISCVTEIVMGETMLRGCDVDLDSQAAFLHSLKHLHTAHAAI